MLYRHTPFFNTYTVSIIQYLFTAESYFDSKIAFYFFFIYSFFQEKTLVDISFKLETKIMNFMCFFLKPEAQWAEPVSITFHSALRKLNTEPSIHTCRCFLPWFIWLRFLRNRPIRNKNCMWWPCLLTDRDKMSNLQRTFHR